MMRARTLAVALLGVAAGAACGGSETEPAAGDEAACSAREAPQFLVVFWDHSTSARSASAADAAFGDSLRTLLDTGLACPGDEVATFLVHARTRGKAHRVRTSHDVEPPEGNGSRNQMTRDSLLYEARLDELREESWSRLRSLVDSTELAGRLTRNTDLLGTFEVLSEELADAPADAVKRVYYFSDMHESMAGAERRDFDSDPPEDRAQAEEWARADAEFVRESMNVRPERFADVEVRVLLERLGDRPATDAVKFYWLTLFQEVGIDPDRVRYN